MAGCCWDCWIECLRLLLMVMMRLLLLSRLLLLLLLMMLLMTMGPIAAPAAARGPARQRPSAPRR